MSVRRVVTLLIVLGVVAIVWMQVATGAFARALPPIPFSELGFGSTLVVHDQMIKDQRIQIAQVTALKDAWLAIHAVDARGEPEPVLGVVRIAAGEYRDVVVPLNTAIKPGETLIAMLHVDRGATAQFEFPGVDEALRVSNQPIMAAFVALGASPRSAQLPDTGIAPQNMRWISLSAVLLLVLGVAMARSASQAQPTPALSIIPATTRAWGEGAWTRSGPRGRFLASIDRC